MSMNNDMKENKPLKDIYTKAADVLYSPADEQINYAYARFERKRNIIAEEGSIDFFSD